MTLHVFNPEHDIALASGLPNFTAPKAGRGMRQDLWWLPKIWAKEDDIILENKESLKGHLSHIDKVEVWGWDSTIRHELLRLGVKPELLPTEEQIEKIRELSNRSLAVELLKELRVLDGTTGESVICKTIEEVEAKLSEWKDTVVKAPWSSSGRGVRYIDIENQGINDLERWIEKTIKQQGSVIAEHKCAKVHDFAVEFISTKEGVKAIGLSWFNTSNTAYTGNLLASEEEKRRLVSQYIPLELLDKVTERLEEMLTPLLKGIYEGPLGVDMMICQKPETWLRLCRLSFAKNLKPETWNYLLNPCIEINLRRTMGHVALELSKRQRGTMSIVYKENKYQLILTKLQKQ